MPAVKSLGRLLPYYRPYRSNVAIGLGLVIVSSALASVVPLFLRRALDGIRAGVALRNIWLLALAMVGVSLVAGALRYWMRDLLNGVSRWIEYDLRNALYAALEALDPSYYARTRTGDLMARMTNDLSAVRMAVGPAIMYLTNTIAGGAFALFFMLCIGGALTIRGAISVGSFVAFGLYLGMLTWPLIALGWVINLFQRGAASMARLLDILDARSLLLEPTSGRALPPTTTNAGRTIEFRNVGFYYPGTEKSDHGQPRWVLRHVSFTAPAGATIGIVGSTGSGKSALMDLVPRLYDPQEGEILLDGVPIRDLSLVTLRTEIGYVPQESFLFSDTIASNLAYGASSADAGRWAAQV